MKKTVLFPLVWCAVFIAWYFISGHLLARDAALFTMLRDRGEPVEAVVVDRTEVLQSRGKTNEHTDYDLKLRIKVSSGKSADVRLKVDKGRYDAHPVDSTMAVVAAPDEPSQYILQEDFDRHGADGMREDAGGFRWLGGALVSTMIAGLVVAFARKPARA